MNKEYKTVPTTTSSSSQLESFEKSCERKTVVPSEGSDQRLVAAAIITAALIEKNVTRSAAPREAIGILRALETELSQ